MMNCPFVVYVELKVYLLYMCQKLYVIHKKNDDTCIYVKKSLCTTVCNTLQK